MKRRRTTGMRLTRQQIKSLATEVVNELSRHGLIELDDNAEPTVAALERAVTDDLRAEDRLNDEVRDILKAHQKEIDQGRMDYNTMFELVKKKLVKERGIIL